MNFKMRKVKIFIREIKIGVSNLVKWFPVIWNDRQWDYEYVYIILKKKLGLMENYFKYGQTTSEDAVKCSNEIKQAVALIERLMEDDYMIPQEEYKKLNSYKEKGEAFTHSIALRNKDKDELYNLLKNNLENWWD